MGYIPQHALHNLNKYKYQGVDKYVRFDDVSRSATFTRKLLTRVLRCNLDPSYQTTS